MHRGVVTRSENVMQCGENMKTRGVFEIVKLCFLEGSDLFVDRNFLKYDRATEPKPVN